MAQRTIMPKKVTREELNALVDRAADLIRTAVDYKFILVLLFMKRLNDLWNIEKQQVKERLVKEVGLSEEEADAEAEKEVYHTFNKYNLGGEELSPDIVGNKLNWKTKTENEETIIIVRPIKKEGDENDL